MIILSFDQEMAPRYMTSRSACADLRAATDLEIDPQSRGMVPTGVFIKEVDWEQVPKGQIPELQIRARSGLAKNHGIMLVNGLGTIDADYDQEIAVLLYNSGDQRFRISKGERIAQLALNLVYRIPNLEIGGGRQGGFGSSG
jgi:dUTP pyrophosphatase